MPDLVLNQRQYLEFEKVALGAFKPLKGFMTGRDFRWVADDMRLPDGTPFPIPVLLDVSPEAARSLKGHPCITLSFEGEAVGQIRPSDFFSCDKTKEAVRIFGTGDASHPGVAHFLRMGDVFMGGPVTLLKRARFDFSDYELTPEETRAHFKQKGWKTVVGFQTRNIPHRAHEYLLRLALEHADGLFIQPLVGTRKQGDFTPEAVLAAYRTLIERFLPKERILLGALSTAMRYAGPREAVFHSIIRRNYGCTHFVIGRDHAGVGDYYGKYEAHELSRRFDKDLGIQILRFCGPFFCSICEGIVTERTCPHEKDSPHAVRYISGTDVRRTAPEDYAALRDVIRPEILEVVAGKSLFIEDEML